MTKTKPKPNKFLTQASVVIVILGALFYFYETLIELAPSTIVQGLMRTFQINGATVGALDTTYFVVYAFMQIPGGSLLDRLGGKVVLTFAAAFCFFGLVLFAVSGFLTIAFISRLITGLGGTFGLLGAMYLINKYIPRQYLAFALGLAIMFGLSGGLFAQPLTNLQHAYGWPTLMLFLALLGGILAAIFKFFLHDEGHPSKIKIHIHVLNNFKTLIRNNMIWPIAIYGGLMYIPTGTLANLWGIEYLKVYYHTDPALAVAHMTAVIFLGWIIGSPLTGLLSDHMQQRRPVVLAGGVGLLLCLLLITWDLHLPPFLMYMVMFGIGLFSSCSGLTFAMGCEIMPKALGGTTVGFINMIAIIPSILIGPLFGAILDHYWLGVTNYGARIYPLVAYQHAMILEYGLVAAALVVGFFFVKETIHHQSV